MATPLYKHMKTKGTSFYAFPNAIKDLSLANFQDNIKISPSKFILLNIPQSYTGTTSNPGKMDFVKSYDPSSYGSEFYSWDPNGPRSNYDFSESLVESLRNYVANADTVYRESKINTNKDFYNPSENKTPTEMLFWKWCKKMNILDLEPAIHKIDWDKNLTDFQNPNASSYTNRDHFRKYLWKERDINEYTCSLTQGSGNVPEITINEIAKLKEGDNIYIYGSGYTGSELSTGTTYVIDSISFTSTETTIRLDVSSYTDSSVYDCNLKLDYHRLVQYIGEVQAVSKVKTSQNNYTEFTAMIPPHAGQSPNILFQVTNNSNYYPGLELPILAEEIQSEIKGAEYLASPIRTNPSDYPGSYFGFFDTVDKTYYTSNGDSVRMSGDYYGIQLTNNDDLLDDDYVEKLSDFNSDTIDGLSVDFNRKHYLKMNLPGSTVKNFDEFNAMIINEEPPSDFEFNAILWYYDIDDGSGSINTNLYGVEFLNNPDDDFGLNDDRLITTTRKLVTNSEQDGLSYIFNLNLDFKVDNSMIPLKYDTSSIYNVFGFDLYNNVMANYGKLNRNFMNIITEFTNMNKKLLNMETILYSQIDLDDIKARLSNLDELVKMYQTSQFVNSDTVKIEMDYSRNYPMIKFNAIQAEYTDIVTMYTTDIFNHNQYSQTTGVTLSKLKLISNYSTSVGSVKKNVGKTVNIPATGKLLVYVHSNIKDETISGNTLSVTIDKDLSFKQSMDIIVDAVYCSQQNDIQFNIFYDNASGNGRVETMLLKPFDLPIDLISYDPDNYTGSTFNGSYYTDVETYVSGATTGTTTDIEIYEDLFESDDWVYIKDFNFKNSSGYVVNYDGLYKVSGKSGTTLTLDLDTNNVNLTIYGKPTIFYYKGVKINILRVNGDDTSTIDQRYLISKEYINGSDVQKINL